MAEERCYSRTVCRCGGGGVQAGGPNAGVICRCNRYGVAVRSACNMVVTVTVAAQLNGSVRLVPEAGR